MPEPRPVRWAATVALTALVVVATSCRQSGSEKKTAAPDATQLLRLNSQGVGYMERYQYQQAADRFRRAAELAPQWVPARINLAIALLNQNKPPSLDEAARILRSVLKDHPDNPHAHYCLAIILNQRGHPEAAEHFRKVTEIDPTDPHAWYYLGKSMEAQDRQAAERCFRKALELNPYLSAALYNLGLMLRRSGDKDGGMALLARHRQLQRQAKWDAKADIKYGLMGRYAEVIGRPPQMAGRRSEGGPLPLFQPVQLRVQLAQGTRWAAASDLDGDPSSLLQRRLRQRFGLTAATLDYDLDGNTDLLLLGAVVRDGRVGDLLLRNLGGWRFEDVTAAAGLAGQHASLGCAIGDFDNDGRPDLFLACAGPNRLFRNTTKGFQDVTERAGVAGGNLISLTARFLDFDQDGDLDLYVANYAQMEHASAALSDRLPPAIPNAAYMNVGPAKAVAADQAGQAGAAALEVAFRPAAEDLQLTAAEHCVALSLGDFDNDRDIDLCLIQDDRPAELVLNERLAPFRRATIPVKVLPPGHYNGAITADFDKDGRMDLWLATAHGPCPLLSNQRAVSGSVTFAAGPCQAQGLASGRLVDLDLDGWLDVVGLAGGRPVLMLNRGDRLAVVPDAFPSMSSAEAGSSGPAATGPAIAAVCSDLDGDGPADLLVVTESGLAAARNLGNGHHWTKVKLTGVRNKGKEMRTNRDAVGSRFWLHAADLWVALDQGAQTAGLGQAYEPILVGLGKRSTIDVLRVRWPDGTLQAELGLDPDRLLVVGQEQRKPVSCPLLFAWNGQRFEYIADFLGGGGLGYLLAPGRYNVPDRDEAIKIEPDQLAPADGRLILKVPEPMDEVTYLDHIRLMAIDHPADVHVYPDERFAPVGMRPQWKLHAYRRPIRPVRATDGHGHDVTAKLAEWDRNVVDDFKLCAAWIGYAEEHSITLDFGDRLAGFGPDDRLVMYLAGWVEYPLSQTNYAAATAGVRLMPPCIERLDDGGRWRPLFPVAGHPAGSPKMMTLDVTGKLTGPRCVLRIRTNMQVYWDQVFVAPELPSGQVRARPVECLMAELGYCGPLTEYSPDGRSPTRHDYHRPAAAHLVRQSGAFTRYGDVLPLLADDDDQFVIFGSGDELTVEFDAGRLPALPSGWRRSYVLRTWGYCKSADVMTACADTVEPLPFRGMSAYPPPPGEQVADPAARARYLRQYNTRLLVGR